MDYIAPTNLLDNKTILITGAGDGIGKALAIKCADLGAKVILLGRTLSKLAAVADHITQLNKQTAMIIELDLNDATEERYITFAQQLTEQQVTLDGLVHNASQLGKLGPFIDIDYDTWIEVMQTNVNAGFLITKHLLPLLQAGTNASTIFTTSSVGHKGRAFWGTYSVSKFATEGMMQLLADEYADTTMRFNAVNPGGTRTSMRASAYPDEDVNRLKTPEEILETYLYLLGDDSLEVTGQRFNAQ
ncbi:YciK family oxidoreductase [Psychromonas sp. B3M02]|uniref:YciK family oxidoreductase n=1 Tax=Psychromonas sp. B3M02 TaxID=2267226 RepID=UPI000DEACDD8|nr:YciK family oxidoreductase [Psychromonas sp. B3M02]RBW47188.1 YciK family oxidoreductase [Psychromonas sp. B3M02]